MKVTCFIIVSTGELLYCNYTLIIKSSVKQLLYRSVSAGRARPTGTWQTQWSWQCLWSARCKRLERLLKGGSTSTVQTQLNFAPVDLLDLRQVEGGAKELGLLHVLPPQPLAQLVELLHAQRGQLARECATLQWVRGGLSLQRTREQQYIAGLHHLVFI